jgi:hypothetical protein
MCLVYLPNFGEAFLCRFLVITRTTNTHDSWKIHILGINPGFVKLRWTDYLIAPFRHQRKHPWPLTRANQQRARTPLCVCHICLGNFSFMLEDSLTPVVISWNGTRNSTTIYPPLWLSNLTTKNPSHCPLRFTPTPIYTTKILMS